MNTHRPYRSTKNLCGTFPVFRLLCSWRFKPSFLATLPVMVLLSMIILSCDLWEGAGPDSTPVSAPGATTPHRAAVNLNEGLFSSPLAVARRSRLTIARGRRDTAALDHTGTLLARPNRRAFVAWGGAARERGGGGGGG